MIGNPERTAKGKKIPLSRTQIDLLHHVQKAGTEGSKGIFRFPTADALESRGLVRREYLRTDHPGWGHWYLHLTSAGYRRLGVEPPAYVRGDQPNLEREPPPADVVATFILEEL